MRSIIRTLIIWASEVVGLAILVWILPGLDVIDWGTGILYIAVVGVLNALLWPMLSRVLLPFMVYTLGFGSLILNALILWLGWFFVDGIYIASFWTLIGTAIGLTIVNTLVSVILTIDDDASYYRHVLIRRLRKERKGEPVKEKPGIIFLEIDGLSEPILRRALDEGHMPTLAKWIKQGSHRLMHWETDTSCQTGGCQAGILHGNNDNMPAFRWVEKENNNKLMTSTGPKDTPMMEARISNGDGLLSENGQSLTNLFSGDAKLAMFTYSRVLNLSELYTPYYYIFFSDPYNFTRTLVLLVWDIILEIRSRRRQERDNVQPRLGKHKRNWMYALLRAMMTVLMRDLTTYTLVGTIIYGEIDAVYATYAAYDEVAHHSGIEDEDAFYILGQLDKSFSRIERAVQESDRSYRLVVLSDHGQSKGATFKQRYKISLEEFIQSLLPEELKIYSQLETNEDWGQASMAITDLANNDESLLGDIARRFSKKRMHEGEVRIGPEGELLKHTQDGELTAAEKAQSIVLASGNMGLIYFTAWKERLSLEQINKEFPDLIDGLVAHEGIGFVLVHSGEHGPMVIGDKGTRYLDDDRVEGEDPLANFRPRSPDHLRRTNSFKYVPDILVNSFYDPVLDEGAAFEELIGFHGGLGGNQAKPFLLFPSEWDLDKEEIVGAEHVYRALKRRVRSVRSVKSE